MVTRFPPSFTVGVVVIVGALIYLSLQPYAALHGDPRLPSSDTVITTSLDHPAEAPIPVSAPYTVPASQPRSISLPSIGASGLIQRIGTDTTGRIVVPTNIHLAGWYVQSARPGETGLSIIDGHVSGAYADGIFIKLATLKPGDTFAVTFGDATVVTFKVKVVETVPLGEADTTLFARDESISSQLNLITCGGTYDRTKRTFDSRVIVVSQRI